MVYLNGNFIEKNQAYISVMDRGFLFGDGIYEVFPVYNKKIIGLDSHLKRLQDGLDAINIKNPHSKDEWTKLIHKVISFDSIHLNQAVYLQISRGSDENRKHTYDELKPTVYIQSSAIKPRKKSMLLDGKWVPRHNPIRSIRVLLRIRSLMT